MTPAREWKLVVSDGHACVFLLVKIGPCEGTIPEVYASFRLSLYDDPNISPGKVPQGADICNAALSLSNFQELTRVTHGKSPTMSPVCHGSIDRSCRR